MKPVAFDYLRAETPEEVLAVLAEHGEEARVLAGGQSLLPMLSMRLARPSVVVDISRLAALDYIEVLGGRVRIGAAAKQAAVLKHRGVIAAAPMLAKALPWVGHVQTRAQGTVCGSVTHADPSGELPLCLLVLDGEVHLRARRRRRNVAAADFFTGMMTTDRRPTELVVEVSFPAATAGEGFGFREFGRRHGDFAIVACAARVGAKGIALGVGGVEDRPVVQHWPLLDGSALDDALNALAWSLDARSDIHADAALRRSLVRALGRDSIGEALSCRC